MATMTSFKQTCPSCEARVLVKNYAMIGRKIECPRCKYPFVVEKPPEEKPPEDEPAANGETAPAAAASKDITEKKPADTKPGKPAKGAKAAARAPEGAVTAQAPAADKKEDAAKDPAAADGAKPAAKKRTFPIKFKLPQLSKMSRQLKIGLGLGAVAIVALIVGLVIMFSRDDGKKGSSSRIAGKPSSGSVAAPASKPGTSGSVVAGNSSSSPKGPGSSVAVKSSSVAKGSGSGLTHDVSAGTELSAWVPGDADMVMATQEFARKLDETAFLGSVLFRTTGAFVRQWVEEKLGVKLADVHQFIVAQGGPPENRWMLTILHVDSHLDPDALLAAMGRGQSSKNTVGKSTYYLFHPNALVEALGDLASGAPNAAQSGINERALFIADDGHTAIVGDKDRLVKLLEEGRAKDGYGAQESTVRSLIDRIQRKQTPLFMALTTKPDPSLFNRLDGMLNTDLSGLMYPADPKEAGLRHMGVALQRLNIGGESNNLTYTIGLEYSSAENAKAAYNTFVSVQKHILADRIWALTGLQVYEPTLPKNIPPGSGRPAPKSSSGSPEPPKPTIAVVLADTAVMIVVDLNWPGPIGNRNPAATVALTNFVRSAVLHTKGRLDMMGNRDALGELSKAVADYVADKKKLPVDDQKFPQGALSRDIPDERKKELGNAPWPVKERLSWMVELLRYLPKSELGKYVQKSEAGKNLWEARHTLGPNDEKLAELGQLLVPQFLAERGSGEGAWWIARVGRTPLAATHWVGMGGIGRDIAREDITKPNVANRAGIFGYDRETNFADIKGGLDRTILMIQIPAAAPGGPVNPDYGPVYPTPWLVAGGTVRGVPEKDSLAEFLCTQRDGKLGTHVIMADGTVRFLAKGAITDDEFKALCTLSADNKPTLKKLDEIAPVVKAEPPPPPKSSGSGSGSGSPPSSSGSGSGSASGSASASGSSSGSKSSSGSGSRNASGSSSGTGSSSPSQSSSAPRGSGSPSGSGSTSPSKVPSSSGSTSPAKGSGSGSK